MPRVISKHFGESTLVPPVPSFLDLERRAGLLFSFGVIDGGERPGSKLVAVHGREEKFNCFIEKAAHG